MRASPVYRDGEDWQITHRWCGLDHFTGIHHHYAVSHTGHHAQVVCNQNNGSAKFAADAIDQIREFAPAQSHPAQLSAHQQSAA